ncbi:hypothetical protein [Actinophytocola sediminis]
MTATPFALVSVKDRNQVFAYGLDIVLPSGRDVIVFRKEANGRNLVGVHDSVEAARRRYSAITPLELVWEPGCRCCLCVNGDDSCALDGTCSSHL